jgi:hypothetical protein
MRGAGGCARDFGKRIKNCMAESKRTEGKAGTSPPALTIAIAAGDEA